MGYFKFKEGAEVYSSDWFYDMTYGGYIKPEELLEDEKQVAEVKSALQTIMRFFEEAEENEVILES